MSAILSDYTFVKVLGKGSYGTASLMRHKHIENTFIVRKDIATGSMCDEDRQRCVREMHILKDVRHPNIVSYIDSFEESRNIIILMEYCDGGDLGQLLKDKKPLSHTSVVRYTIQILLALQYLHSVKKILHRDLKPGNIFLTAAGQVKLGDFGASTMLHQSIEFAKTFCGTPYYLAPEVCMERPYNSRADMWSLGCIVYEMCTGVRPFLGKNIVELADKITRGEFEPMPVTVHRGLHEVVDALLQRVPEVRPSALKILKSAFVQENLALMVQGGLNYDEARAAVAAVQKVSPKAVEAEGERSPLQPQTKAKTPSTATRGDVSAMEAYIARDRAALRQDEASKGFIGTFDLSQELSDDVRRVLLSVGEGDDDDDVILSDTSALMAITMKERNFAF
eukprot:PhM_4_TR5430/c0_g1_i1/m.18389/K08857/NEK1_4_5; NIMA (never in mitosis gene a)-related kinase 1/4/5